MFKIDPLVWKMLEKRGHIDDAVVWAHLSNPSYAIVTENFDEISFEEFQKDMTKRGIQIIEFSSSIDFC